MATSIRPSIPVLSPSFLYHPYIPSFKSKDFSFTCIIFSQGLTQDIVLVTSIVLLRGLSCFHDFSCGASLHPHSSSRMIFALVIFSNDTFIQISNVIYPPEKKWTMPHHPSWHIHNIILQCYQCPIF